MRRFLCNLSFLALFSGFLGSCSSPPVIRHTVADPDVRAVNITFLGRANAMKEDWEAAKKEMAVEKQRTTLLRLDEKLAKAWVKAARIQLKRASLTPPANQGDKNVKAFKSKAQAEKELELAQKNLSFVRNQLKLNRKRLELLEWKIYAAQARYLEELVLAMHKAQVPPAGRYSKVKFADQAYSVRRKFLVREEKIAAMEANVKTLEKELGDRWHPELAKPAAGAKQGPCPACPPCPDAAPCKCPTLPAPAANPPAKPAEEKPATEEKGN